MTDPNEVRRETVYEELYEQSPDMYVSVDAETARIKFCNATTTERLGYTKKEIIGRPVFEMYDASCLPDVRNAFQQFVATGKIDNVELLLRKKDGGTIPVLLSVRSVRRGDGTVDHSISTWRDITNLKHIAHLQDLNRQLQRSNDELEQFAYVVSHDLQEPLRMVSSFTTLLEKELGADVSDTAKRYMHFARGGAIRMQSLVEDLLTYSRIGRDERPGQVEVAEILKDVMEDLELAFHESEAAVELGELPQLTFDRTALRQLFSNLIANAIKFRSAAPPRISVEATREKDSWLFSVKDNGIGIEERHHKRVFRMFQRLHRREDYEGTGVGLAICRKIVEGHDGRIWLESEAGQGTTVWFRIPDLRARSL